MGQPAELSFSVYYASPEVMKAYKGGETSIVAQPSADVWALGVRSLLAFALFAFVCGACGRQRALCANRLRTNHKPRVSVSNLLRCLQALEKHLRLH